MRPVSRGNSPNTFSDYRQAAAPLVDRLGAYCSYCERYIETHLAVEHVSPKSIDPLLEFEWANFLLACVNCNSSKGSTPVALAAYVWPDIDNTLRALTYEQALVTPRVNLDASSRRKAESLIRLIGLDKDPGNTNALRKPGPTDRRWRYRQDRWDVAQRSLQRLILSDTPAMREQIAETATSRGGFGIWFTVFGGDEDMRRRLVVAFPGTAHDCFDAQARPIERPGGQL